MPCRGHLEGTPGAEMDMGEGCSGLCCPGVMLLGWLDWAYAKEGSRMCCMGAPLEGWLEMGVLCVGCPLCAMLWPLGGMAGIGVVQGPRVS